MSHRILVVEDDPFWTRLYSRLLGSRLHLDITGTVAEARRRLSAAPVDAILLDWVLPDGTGLSFIDELRRSEQHRDVLIFMVTAQTGRDRCLEALRTGADDFMEKPIDKEMLVARLDSLTRRKVRQWADARPFSCDGLSYDPGKRKVSLKGKELPLRRKELRLLEVFMEKPNKVISKDALWTAVWGPQALHWEHTLEVTLCNLRHALGSWSARIQTHAGLGYMLSTAATPPGR